VNLITVTFGKGRMDPTNPNDEQLAFQFKGLPEGTRSLFVERVQAIEKFTDGIRIEDTPLDIARKLLAVKEGAYLYSVDKEHLRSLVNFLEGEEPTQGIMRLRHALIYLETRIRRNKQDIEDAQAEIARVKALIAEAVKQKGEET